MTNFDKGNEHIKELSARRQAYTKFIHDHIATLFRNKERQVPSEFEDSSFLYLRSYALDVGERPFTDTVFWISPDVFVNSTSSPAQNITTLTPGEIYTFGCTIRNGGDRTVSSAKAEFFITNPSLGLDSRFARSLGVASTWLNAGSTDTISVQSMLPPSETGHRCLFARVFAFSPPDLPLNDYLLDPTLDRHVAQLNINIVEQGELYSFSLIHAPNTNEVIEFIPMAREDVLGLQRLIDLDHIIVEGRETPDFIGQTQLQLTRNGTNDIQVEHSNNRFEFISHEPLGVGIEQRREIYARITRFMREGGQASSHNLNHRKIYADYRAINEDIRESQFQIRIPNFNLQLGEVMGLQIKGFDKVLGTPKGGITLIVKG